jgi:hypothetical protein
MGSGYNWMTPPQSGTQTGMESYLSTQIGKEGPQFSQGLTTQMPGTLMDVQGMWQKILGGAGAGKVGTTPQGFPMGPTGAFPGMGFLGTAQQGMERMLSERGSPTTTAGYASARKAQYSQELSDQLNRVMAQRAASGRSRYSSGSQRAIAETAGRSALGFGTEMERLRFGAEESARGREMGIFGMAPGFAQTQAGIPLSYLQSAGQFGMGQWQMQQGQRQQEYDAWLRRQYGYRPEFQMAGSYGQPYAPTATPNPWISLLQGLLQGGAQVGAAAAGKPG